MPKPEFSLSVTRYFTYRAKLSTGDTLETDSFKSLFRFTLRHLRDEVFSVNRDEYSHAEAVLEFGYCTMYEVRKGYFYSEFVTLTEFGELDVSTFSESFYRCSTDDWHYMRDFIEESATNG